MRKTLLTAFSLICMTCSACWYTKSNYIDYIYSVNDIPITQTNMVDDVMEYTITNNIVVDLPLTISMKLISDQEVVLNSRTSMTNIPELINGKLQYRILPNGGWVTVQEYNTKTGTIQKDSEPKCYFGQNNIYPLNCKKGDVIMIRLFVTDGMWCSGQLDSKCDDKLVSIPGGKKKLPDRFSYRMNGSDLVNFNLGGDWYPHFCITVVYSGNERPIR